MTVTYRAGYGTSRKTLDELKAWPQFANIHPEVQRRVIALLNLARHAGVDLGIGGGFRSTQEQFALFNSRHNVVTSGGCCTYDGKHWALVAGCAHAAPPNQSYHEGTVSLNGRAYGVALDMIGYESGWMEKNLASVGMRSFAGLSGSAREPWHIQPVEVPTERAQYNPTMHTLKVWALPTIPTAHPAPGTPIPTPTIKLGSTGTEVKELQQHATFWGWYTATIDGSCGPVTVDAIKKMQVALKQTVDGMYGPATALAYTKFLQVMGNLS